MNNNMYQHIPLADAYEIFKEKCLDEGINLPTFETYKARTLNSSHLDKPVNYGPEERTHN